MRPAVRPAASSDAPGILRCLAEAFEPFRSQYTPEGFRDTTLTAETIAERLRTMQVFVADAGGDVVGTIGGSVHGHGGHIRGMAVLPAWQGRGIADALLASVEDYLRGRGCRIVTLDTTAPLQRAIAFYLRNGYRVSGKISDFYGMPLYEYVKNL